MIFVRLTNGFGNNLFQYIAGRLLAEHHKKELVLIPPFKDYYGLNEIIKLGLKFDAIENQIDLSSCELITEKNYLLAYKNNCNNTNLVLKGYFEDYTYYYDHLKKIRTWFPFSAKRENNDLVLHLRTGDRLLYKAHYKSNGEPIIDGTRIVKAINQIEFDKLFIVSDLPKFEKVDMNEFKQYQFHVNVSHKDSIDYNWALQYHNSLIDIFSKYDPIFKKREISADFSFIRSFNNILFQHSTFAWWAAVLSDAKSVGVYGPWRPYKNYNNKNLSKVPLKGWYQWE